ncbi:hypothetical protein [Neisseria animalis]|uniref:hypothetical protein n=1 Tax=Neisseria animalis TaxID=492 RepID=UPI001E56C270|nr:hypothetical protein [Neisseria animalis]
MAEAQIQSADYIAANGQKITAVYLNSHSPMIVELHQGNAVESLKLLHAWTHGAEYGNFDTRWHIRAGSATLTRRDKQLKFDEVIQ